MCLSIAYQTLAQERCEWESVSVAMTPQKYYVFMHCVRAIVHGHSEVNV